MNLRSLIANPVDCQWSTVYSDQEMVQEIQQHLHRLGFNPGGTNGVWTQQTQQAFDRFRVANQLSNAPFSATTARSLLKSVPVVQRQVATTAGVKVPPPPPSPFSTRSVATPTAAISAREPRRVAPVPPPPSAIAAQNNVSHQPPASTRPQRVNPRGINLLKQFEKLRLEASQCPAGIITIGYGSTANVKLGQKITPYQAEVLLRQNLRRFEAVVEKTVMVPLTSNQFSALVCFVFNIGVASFKTSTLLKLLNEGNYAATAEQFLRWNKINKQPIPRLTQRRQAERNLFLQG